MNFRRSVIIAELWRPEVASEDVNNLSKILRSFWKKGPLTIKFSEFSFESFTPHRSTCCVQMSGNWWNRALFMRQKHFACTSLTVATSRPKSASDVTMYSECSRFHQDRFTFGGVTTERVNTAKTPVNPIFGWSLARLRAEW